MIFIWEQQQTETRLVLQLDKAWHVPTNSFSAIIDVMYFDIFRVACQKEFKVMNKVYWSSVHIDGYTYT